MEESIEELERNYKEYYEKTKFVLKGKDYYLKKQDSMEKKEKGEVFEVAGREEKREILERI